MPKTKRVVQTSGPAPKQARHLPLANKEALLARFAGYPAIDVITRRFSDPNDPGSLPILLNDESPDACLSTDHQNQIRENATICHKCKKPVRQWVVRWINTSIEGRWGQIKSKGYVPVEVTSLKDEQDVSDLVTRAETSGEVYVRRGDRGQEVLCKMPLELYVYLKRAQRESQRLRSNSKKALREELAEAAGTELGDEAGEALMGDGISIERMRRTRRSLEDEIGDASLDAIDQ